MRKVLLPFVLGMVLAPLPLAAEETEPMTVDAFVARVIERNPSLAAARAAWTAADRSVEATGVNEDPMLMYAIAPLAAAQGDLSGVHQVELSQSLRWPGKNGLERRMADAEAGMARQRYQAALLDTVAEAKLAWADHADAALEIRALEDQREQLGHVKEVSAAGVAAGRRMQADLLAVDVEDHMVHERILMLTGRLEATRAQLEALAGGALEGTVTTWIPPIPVAPGASTASVPPALDKQPEIQMAHLAAERAAAAAELARKDRYPDLGVFAGLNTMWPERPMWLMAGVRVNLPVRTGRRRAAEDAADAARESERRQLEAMVLERKRAAAAAEAELRAARQSEDLSRRILLPLAERRLASLRSAYAAGQASMDDWLQANRDWIAAQLMAERAALTRFRAAVALARANAEEMTNDRLQMADPKTGEE